MSEAVRRRDATQATLDAWRGRKFKLGHADCVRLAADHLRRMGHKVRLPAKGKYATVRSALKELKARGYADLPAALDDMGLEQIAPAAARIGDIIAIPSEHAIGCLMVAVGNGRTLGWQEDHEGAEVFQPVEYVGAWRV
ncbi:DUF6950 family protein [Sphingomonas dokdonensis]|uniref:DUF6950 domain-containing protein n=1 Tax=Sphingomonas dokdonensis TaxID=344880 RepID=A0A245ZHJ7_9SPHN|nr:hypothetical protein [Sphingomonas dokdonensis]OWK29214.1 hypothetical protein SPDO_21950 [Sphingomonas dokdonensis]